MRIRSIPLAILFISFAQTPLRADPLHRADDRPLSLGFQTGFLHTRDSSFNATWIRPEMIDLGWSLRLNEGPWFGTVRLYGSAVVDFARIRYREDPASYEEGLAGIHRADILIGANLTLGAGLGVSVYDDGRFHLLAFGDYAAPPWNADVDVQTLVLDVNGLRIDTAKAVREYAEVDFSWSAMRLGGTFAVSFEGSDGRRFVPYLTAGWLRSRAVIGFDVNPRLEEALERVHVDVSLLHPRAIENDSPFGMLGFRYDLGPDLSVETGAMFGRYDGVWVVAGNAGLTVRFSASD